MFTLNYLINVHIKYLSHFKAFNDLKTTSKTFIRYYRVSREELSWGISLLNEKRLWWGAWWGEKKGNGILRRWNGLPIKPHIVNRPRRPSCSENTIICFGPSEWTWKMHQATRLTYFQWDENMFNHFWSIFKTNFGIFCSSSVSKKNHRNSLFCLFFDNFSLEFECSTNQRC